MTTSPGAPEYPLGDALDFLRNVWELSHALERLSRRMERELGVTAQQRLIVRCVGKYPGMTAGQLAAVLHLDPGTLSAAFRRLEEKGLLKRRSDPRDRRRVTLALTTKGLKLNQPAAGTVEHAVEQLLQRSTGRDVLTTKKMLRRLAQLLDTEAQ